MVKNCENCKNKAKKNTTESVCIYCTTSNEKGSVPSMWELDETKAVAEETSKERNCTTCIYENFNINDMPCKSCVHGGGNEECFVEKTCKYCKHDSRADWEEPCISCATENGYEYFRLAEHYKSAEHETEEINNAVHHPNHYQGKYECMEMENERKKNNQDAW